MSFARRLPTTVLAASLAAADSNFDEARFRSAFAETFAVLNALNLMWLNG